MKIKKNRVFVVKKKSKLIFDFYLFYLEKQGKRYIKGKRRAFVNSSNVESAAVQSLLSLSLFLLFH